MLSTDLKVHKPAQRVSRLRRQTPADEPADEPAAFVAPPTPAPHAPPASRNDASSVPQTAAHQASRRHRSGPPQDPTRVLPLHHAPRREHAMPASCGSPPTSTTLPPTVRMMRRLLNHPRRIVTSSQVLNRNTLHQSTPAILHSKPPVREAHTPAPADPHSKEQTLISGDRGTAEP